MLKLELFVDVHARFDILEVLSLGRLQVKPRVGERLDMRQQLVDEVGAKAGRVRVSLYNSNRCFLFAPQLSGRVMMMMMCSYLHLKLRPRPPTNRSGPHYKQHYFLLLLRRRRPSTSLT